MAEGNHDPTTQGATNPVASGGPSDSDRGKMSPKARATWAVVLLVIGGLTIWGVDAYRWRCLTKVFPGVTQTQNDAAANAQGAGKAEPVSLATLIKNPKIAIYQDGLKGLDFETKKCAELYVVDDSAAYALRKVMIVFAIVCIAVALTLIFTFDNFSKLLVSPVKKILDAVAGEKPLKGGGTNSFLSILFTGGASIIVPIALATGIAAGAEVFSGGESESTSLAVADDPRLEELKSEYEALQSRYDQEASNARRYGIALNKVLTMLNSSSGAGIAPRIKSASGLLQKVLESPPPPDGN